MSVKKTIKQMAIWRPSHELARNQTNPTKGSIQVSPANARSPEFHNYLKTRAAFDVIAEGDSWFDLPRSPFGPGALINALDNTPGFNLSILNLAKYGETLDTIAYGGFDENGNTIPPGMDAAVAAARIHQPKAFLFSAGGNDIAGPEFKMLLNHKATTKKTPPRPELRKEVVDFLIHDYIKSTYLDCAKRIWTVTSKTKIFLHGYANAWPTGIGYKILFITLAGPWLLPSIWEKGYSQSEGKKIVTALMNEFALMLQDVAATDSRFFVMDFRNHIGNKETDWHDELHLTWPSYLAAAKPYAKLIKNNI